MDISEVLKTLKEDYALRKSLKRKKLLVHDELEDEIDDLEQSYITTSIMPKLEAYAKELLKDLECETCLSIMKDANGDIRVGNEYDYGYLHETDEDEANVHEKDSASDTETTTEANLKTNEAEAEQRTRGHVKKFEVRLGGKVVEGKDGAGILSEAIRQIGYERVAALNIMFVKGAYNLVDRCKRTDQNKLWQRQSGDWYIYTNTSNPTKADNLAEIAQRLGLDMQIILEGEQYYPKK